MKITSIHIALYVFIDSDIYDLVCSDNFFSIETNETKEIYLKNKLFSESIEDLKVKDLKVRTLYDLLS